MFGKRKEKTGSYQNPGSNSRPPLYRKPQTENRKLIFTADDFGLSPALNNAVSLAHRHGLLCCASLMPGAPAADQARALARTLPDLCLGVHLTLCQGKAILSPREIPNLVNSWGLFRDDPVKAGWQYFFKPRILAEIRWELAAQIEAALAAGLTLWHLNSHLNLHLHPRLFPLAVRLAKEYGIPAIRLGREDWRTTLALAPDRPLPKVVQGLIFTWLTHRARRLAQDAGLVTNDHLFGLLNDGRMTEDHILRLIPRLKGGLTEIYSHPALGEDYHLRRWAPHYRRQEEMTALLSPRLKDALTGAGIKVSDYRREAFRRAGRSL